MQSFGDKNPMSCFMREKISCAFLPSTLAKRYNFFWSYMSRLVRHPRQTFSAEAKWGWTVELGNRARWPIWIVWSRQPVQIQKKTDKLAMKMIVTRIGANTTHLLSRCCSEHIPCSNPQIIPWDHEIMSMNHGHLTAAAWGHGAKYPALWSSKWLSWEGSVSR